MGFLHSFQAWWFDGLIVFRQALFSLSPRRNFFRYLFFFFFALPLELFLAYTMATWESWCLGVIMLLLLLASCLLLLLLLPAPPWRWCMMACRCFFAPSEPAGPVILFVGITSSHGLRIPSVYQLWLDRTKLFPTFYLRADWNDFGWAWDLGILHIFGTCHHAWVRIDVAFGLLEWQRFTSFCILALAILSWLQFRNIRKRDRINQALRYWLLGGDLSVKGESSLASVLWYLCSGTKKKTYQFQDNLEAICSRIRINLVLHFSFSFQLSQIESDWVGHRRYFFFET